MTDPAGVLEIDPDALVERVRAALGRPRAELVSWDVAAVEYPNFSFGARAVHRVSGRARDGGADVPWSIIVKTFALPPPEAEAEANDIPSDYAYWKREPLAFDSGVLAGLTGGLRAPDCYGVDWRGDETAWVWLEELSDDLADAWPVERYGLAARHLGEFNGAYLAGRPLADDPWLASARSVAEYWTVHPANRQKLDTLRDPERWRACCAARLGADGEIDALRAFLDDRSAILDALDRLPQAFCHNDAMRSNLFATGSAAGVERTAAIDWALAGLGPVGGELALLVAGSVMFLKVPAVELGRLDEVAVAEYLRGLAEAGADVDEAVVRFGYAACSVLRMSAIVSAWLQMALDPADADWAADFWARPTEGLLAAWGPLLGFLERQASYALGCGLR
jgi:hypothetical protein